MHFTVHAVLPEQMDQWVVEMKKSPNQLTLAAYGELLNQSVNDKPAFYAGVEPALFDSVLMLYMHSTGPVHPRANQLKIQYPAF